MKQTFPFSAVVGHQSLKLALLLNAIDNRIGGVVISGPRGSAKSTLSRALADVAGISLEKFVTLPLGATEERVVGTLDVEKILQQGELKFSPGILHQAHDGILYVDEVNLLPDPIVDLLLDVAASGINVVERDGVSKQHPSRFVLIGTMNPDEGELRPQLLDRFGLCVEMTERLNLDQRIQVVERRIAFDRDSDEFIRQYRQQQAQLKQKIEDARSNLNSVIVSEECKRYVCELCEQAQVDGVRADITLLRAATANAAWRGVPRLEQSMVDEVAEFVLCHRRQIDCSTTLPLENQQHGENSKVPQQDQKPNRQSGEQDKVKTDIRSQGSFGEMPPVSVGTGAARNINSILEAASSDTTKKKHLNNQHRLNPVGSRRNFTRVSVEQNQNQNLSTSQLGNWGSVNWHASIVDSANNIQFKQTQLPLKLGDIIRRHRSSKTTHLNMILLDTSGSTLSETALQQAKAIVGEINTVTYLNRDRIALMTFGNDKVDMLIPPSRAGKTVQHRLNGISAAGGTPLRKGLLQAKLFLMNRKRIEINEEATLYVITDGRSNDETSDIKIDTPVVFIDSEVTQVRLNRSLSLSQQLNAEYLHIDDIPFAEGPVTTSLATNSIK